MTNRLKTSTGAFARQQASRLLRQLTVQIARTVKSAGDDEVHDVRVAIRRFQAVLKALGPCFPGEAAKIRLTLKRIMGLAGEVRNRDIGVELLVKLACPAAAPLVIRFESERTSAVKDLTDSLKFWVRTKTSARWRTLLNTPLKPGSKADQFGAGPIELTAIRMMPRIAGKQYNRGQCAAADDKTTHHELHQFRIATKKFRYTLDLFAPVFGDSVDDLVRELKDIQTLLGDINDYVTVRSMVRSMVRQSARRVSPRSDPDQKSAREISAAIREVQRAKTREFRAHWSTAFTHAKVLQWREILQQGGEKR